MEKETKKIVIVRIKGKIDLPPDVRETFKKLKLLKKFSCRIIEDKPELLGMVKKIKDYVAYGYIAEETLKQLLEKRGKPEKKDIEQTFSLHPPRGGFKKSTKLAWPKGILGKNEKINELLLKML